MPLNHMQFNKEKPQNNDTIKYKISITTTIIKIVNFLSLHQNYLLASLHYFLR